MKTTAKKKNYYYRAAIKMYLRMQGRFEEMARLDYLELKIDRIRRRQPNFISSDRIFRIVNAISDDKMKVAALIQMFTGCRSYEALMMKWGQLASGEGFTNAHIKDEKTNKDRNIGIKETIMERINSIKPDKAKKADFIFFDGTIKRRSLYCAIAGMSGRLPRLWMKRSRPMISGATSRLKPSPTS